MRTRIRAGTWLVLGLAVVLTACSSAKGPGSVAVTGTTVAGAVNPNGTESLPPGDIPDNQVFVAYSSPQGGYSVKYPQGWAQRTSGATSTFSQNFNTMTVTAAPAASAPTLASARAQVAAKLQSVPGFKLGTIDQVSRTSGPAIRIAYQATSPTDPVTGKSVPLDVERYLFWRNGKLVTITLSSAHGSDNVDPWKTVTDSFTWR
jgi:hypothetical protein